jgi:hypothetical protein
MMKNHARRLSENSGSVRFQTAKKNRWRLEYDATTVASTSFPIKVIIQPRYLILLGIIPKDPSFIMRFVSINRVLSSTRIIRFSREFQDRICAETTSAYEFPPTVMSLEAKKLASAHPSPCDRPQNKQRNYGRSCVRS